MVAHSVIRYDDEDVPLVIADEALRLARLRQTNIPGDISTDGTVSAAGKDIVQELADQKAEIDANTDAVTAQKAINAKIQADMEDISKRGDRLDTTQQEQKAILDKLRSDADQARKDIDANKNGVDEAKQQADAAKKATEQNAAAIEANKAEQEKADAEIKADVKKNADQIIANKTEADKADTAIRNDLKTTQDAVRKNTDANTAQQQQIDATKSALDQANKTISQHTQAIANAQKQADAAKAQAEANADRIEQNTAGIDAIQQHQAEVDKTITQAQSDIKTATSTAQKALDKANSVGTSVDGLHNVFTGPDDPTTLDGVTVKDGDLWNQTGSYWTRWQGDPDNSASLLADFYTYWQGDSDDSPSVLVPLNTRVIATYKFDGQLNMWVELSNADMDTVKQALKDNQKQLEDADKNLAQTNKDLEQAKTDLAKAKTDIAQANKDITTNRNNLAEANKDITANSNAITQANKDITANKTGLAQANKDIAAANKTIAGNTAAIETNRQNITNAASTAQKALDKANSVGTSLDGLHNIYTGPDDPTTLKGVTVRQGDLWYRTQKYWTRWQDTPNNSASLLADFYTYWTGEPNNSASVLVPLSSRIVDASVYDGTQWNQINLVAANILATGSVVTSNLAANAVTADKITANAITSDKISANAITAAKLAANSVTADKITANAVTTDKLAANSVDASKIVAKTITGDKIAANAITAGNLAANSVTADKIAANAVTADKIKAGSVTSDKITANAVTGDKIAANSVTAGKIAAKSINASHMTANSIVSDAIAANAVTADKIKAGAITADKIAAGSITSDKIKGNLLSGTTVEGGTFRTLNGRLVINDTGILLKDAKGAATLSALTADGSVTMRGALTSGSTITGTTITGSQFTTTGKHVDISDDGMVFTDADGNPVLTWAPVRMWTRWAGTANNSASMLADFYTEWLGEENNSPSRLTTLADKWRLVMDAPIMSSATISGSTLKGGVIEGAEYRGLKPDGTRYLTINSNGMAMGDKLAYDSTKGQLVISGTIKASTLTGSTITTTNGRLTINDTGIVLKKADGTATLTANAATGSISMTGTIKASTVTGSTITTTNGKMLWNDTGLVLKNANGTPTLTMKTSDGSITLKGSITSGSTISGATITGGIVKGAEIQGHRANNGTTFFKLNPAGFYLLGKDGKTTALSYDANNETLTIPKGSIGAATITGATIHGATITGATIQSNTWGHPNTASWRLRNADFQWYDTTGRRTLAIGSDGRIALTGTMESGTVLGGEVLGAYVKAVQFEGYKTFNQSNSSFSNLFLKMNSSGFYLMGSGQNEGSAALAFTTSNGALTVKGTVRSSTIIGSTIQTDTWGAGKTNSWRLNAEGFDWWNSSGEESFKITAAGKVTTLDMVAKHSLTVQSQSWFNEGTDIVLKSPLNSEQGPTISVGGSSWTAYWTPIGDILQNVTNKDLCASSRGGCLVFYGTVTPKSGLGADYVLMDMNRLQTYLQPQTQPYNRHFWGLGLKTNNAANPVNVWIPANTLELHVNNAETYRWVDLSSVIIPM